MQFLKSVLPSSNPFKTNPELNKEGQQPETQPTSCPQSSLKLSPQTMSNISSPHSNRRARIFKTADPEFAQVTPSVQSAFMFVERLVQRASKIRSQQERQGFASKDKRKREDRDTFLKELTIQPIYVHDDGEMTKKDTYMTLLQFEFQLGSDQFLQRVAILYQQLHLIDRAIEGIANSQLCDTFTILSQYGERLENLCLKITLCRQALSLSYQFSQIDIRTRLQKQQALKRKISFLRAIKQAHRGLHVVHCQSLDQVFYSQKSRLSYYKKLQKSRSILSKVNCLKQSESRMLSRVQINAKIVEQAIIKWRNGQIDQKGIEKILIMVYWSRREKMYVDNGLRIRIYKEKGENKEQLREWLAKEVQKIKAWKSYRYVNDESMREKVGKFLDQLLKQVTN